jgi:hypothetical protein
MMPEKIKRKLKAQARKKGLTGPKADAYVYGTLNKIKTSTTVADRRKK